MSRSDLYCCADDIKNELETADADERFRVLALAVRLQAREMGLTRAEAMDKFHEVWPVKPVKIRLDQPFQIIHHANHGYVWLSACIGLPQPLQ